jgi:hypothetical protein
VSWTALSEAAKLGNRDLIKYLLDNIKETPGNWDAAFTGAVQGQH